MRHSLLIATIIVLAALPAQASGLTVAGARHAALVALARSRPDRRPAHAAPRLLRCARHSGAVVCSASARYTVVQKGPKASWEQCAIRYAIREERHRRATTSTRRCHTAYVKNVLTSSLAAHYANVLLEKARAAQEKTLRALYASEEERWKKQRAEEEGVKARLRMREETAPNPEVRQQLAELEATPPPLLPPYKPTTVLSQPECRRIPAVPLGWRCAYSFEIPGKSINLRTTRAGGSECAEEDSIWLEYTNGVEYSAVEGGPLQGANGWELLYYPFLCTGNESGPSSYLLDPNFP